MRTDEWYNFTAEPQNVHVLAKLDENTYNEEDGTPEADDHPIAWCSNFDRGRHFYTGLGHNGTAWQEAGYLSHIRGGIEWAAGAVPGECGAPRDGIPTDASFDKVTLDDNTENPMEIAIAPGGNVYVVELAGKVKYYNATTRAVRTVGTIPVHRGNENGLLGIALDPGFATNKWLYLFYSAPTPEEQHVSRFTVGEDGNIDMASEKVLLRIPHQRIVCCHSAGSMTFGPGGLLHISTGDDTEHSQSQGFNPIDDDVLRNNPGSNPDADRAYDARRTSGNTNDLRGKILRIKPEADGTYSIPPGNLFPPFESDPTKTKPEIYTMGHRNPFRIAVDQQTGWVYNGEVGPTRATRTPTAARAATTSSIRSARRATWAGRTASPTTSPTATGRSRAARPARRSTARAARTTPPTTTPAWPRRRGRPAPCCGGRTRRTRRASRGRPGRPRSRRARAARRSPARRITSTRRPSRTRSCPSTTTSRSSSPTGRATGSRR